MDPQALWWIIPMIIVLAALFTFVLWTIGVMVELVWAAFMSLVDRARAGRRS